VYTWHAPGTKKLTRAFLDTGKTKRVTLHQKYKVERKVREHHKKQRREAKKNPDKRQSSLGEFG
jgi:hypothetical protein